MDTRKFTVFINVFSDDFFLFILIDLKKNYLYRGEIILELNSNKIRTILFDSVEVKKKELFISFKEMEMLF